MRKVISCFVIILYAGCSYGQKAEVFTTESGAIDGYDPVAYFEMSKAVEGKQQYAYQWKGTDWYFANEENMDAFKETPEKYAPKFGGYCAYAVSQGYTAKIDPNAWSIVGGQLYLNYNKEVQKKWDEKQQEYIGQANENWPKVLEKKDE